MAYKYKILKYEPTGFWNNTKRFLRHGRVALSGDDFWVLLEHNGRKFWEAIEPNSSYRSLEDQIQNAIYWKFYRKQDQQKTMEKFVQFPPTEKGEKKDGV